MFQLAAGRRPAFASCARLRLDKLKHVPPRLSETSAEGSHRPECVQTPAEEPGFVSGKFEVFVFTIKSKPLKMLLSEAGETGEHASNARWAYCNSPLPRHCTRPGRH